MAILVCASTGRELAALAPALFPDPDKVPEMTPMLVETKQRRLIFINTGVGPLNAALAAGLALGLTFDKDKNAPGVGAILCAGLAGAYDLEKNPLRSLWLVKEEIWPEYGLNDGSDVTARAFSFPLWKRDEEDVYDRISLNGASALTGKADEEGKPWPSCKSVTVAGVSASFARREKLYNKYGTELENMEGFAIAYAAARAEIPRVEVRAVSNRIGPRSKHEKDFDGALRALGKILPTLNLI
ncbi:MAG: futalosine hydrolase [Desulfovibrio sp.]|nr:futalosine hydrolase [Desulfovibrio sp.]